MDSGESGCTTEGDIPVSGSFKPKPVCIGKNIGLNLPSRAPALPSVNFELFRDVHKTAVYTPHRNIYFFIVDPFGPDDGDTMVSRSSSGAGSGVCW